MCITTEPARLTNTTIYSAEAQRNGETFHVIGYQNTVVAKKGPNAMILPLPAAGPLGPANCIDTRGFKDILKAYNQAVERLRPKRRSRSTKAFGSDHDSLDTRGFQVFQSGSYTVALAERPVTMRLALDAVPEKVRPEIPGSFLAALAQLYPDWPMAICCFDGNLEAPEPLLWWFKPKFPHVLFAPAIDGHDGNPPNVKAQVDRDHTIAFGSYRSERSNDTQLVTEIQRQVPIEHQWMFQTSVVGSKIEGTTGNGDFSLPVSAVLDLKIPQYLKDLDVTPPPMALPTVYERISGGGAFA